MKITIFQQAPDLGGSEFYIVNLVKQWVKNGDQVRVYTNYDELKNLFRKSGAEVYHLPFILDIIGNTRGFIKTLGLLPFALLWYQKTLESIKAKTDVIVMSNFTEKLLVTFLSKKLNIPVVWLEYPPLETLISRNLGIPKYFYKKAASIPKCIITISDNTLTSLVNDTKIAKSKLKLIYPGVEVPSKKEIIRAKRKAKQLRDKLGLEEKIVIGNISRVAAEKEQELLIRAFRKVKKEVSNSALLIIGRGPDVDRLKQIAIDLKLENDVHVLGFMKDRNSALAMMDIFVFPAAWELEGFGLVLTEAMMMNTPIVSVTHGPTVEIINHLETGLLIQPRNPKAIRNAILKLVKDTDLSERLVLKAHRIAKEKFDIIQSAKRIRTELKNATEKN